MRSKPVAHTSLFVQLAQGIPIRRHAHFTVLHSKMMWCLVGHTSAAEQVRDWRLWGLPADDVSVDNGILVSKGKRWPLMIDPQGQANAWVRNMEGRAGLKLVKLNQANFLRLIEGAVRLGQPVLVEDVGETIDPALEPLLLKQVCAPCQ